MKHFTVIGIIAAIAVAAINADAQAKSLRIPQAAVNQLVTAPLGSCANNFYRFGCPKFKDVRVANRRGAIPCHLTASSPNRSANWASGVSTLQCSGDVVSNRNVWAILRMNVLYGFPRGWQEAARSWRQGYVRLAHGWKAWATAWSQCTGGFGYPHYLRAWEAQAHATVLIDGHWYPLGPESNYDNLQCVHDM